MDRAVAVIAGEYAACRARLLAIPTKCAPLLATMTDAAEVRGVLKQQVEETLAELSAEDVLGERLT